MTNNSDTLKLVEGDDGTDEPETEEAGAPAGTATEVEAEDVPEVRSRWRRVLHPTRREAGLGCLVVLLIAAIATAAVFGWNLREERAVAAAGRDAVAAAQQYAVILTSVDASKLDENFAAVLDGATGEFKDMYSQSSAQLKTVLVDAKARADGKVLAAGVKSATPDKVEVMLFVDQAVTNTLNPEPRLDRSRIVMTMEKVDGRWLASDVELP